MKKLFLLSFTAVISLHSQAQKEFNIWTFGDHAGLDFNSGVPVPYTTSSLYAHEGCATICDTAGNLLFYTNGGDQGVSPGGIWNRNDSLMPNGDLNGFGGCHSSTQGSVIVPDPGNPNIFYLFTADCVEHNFTGGMRYSTIDMTLDGGKGDVVVKQQLLVDSVTESMIAVRHSNCSDFWVIAHKIGMGYYAFQVTAGGIMPYVFSYVGMAVQGLTGQMNVNHAGNKLAYCIYPQAEMLDFDNSSGVLSNVIDLNVTQQGALGCAFSPSDEFLYMVANTNPYSIFQFDMNAPNIPNSRQTAATCTNSLYEMMQLGPDGKIYLATAFNSSLDVIEYPDSNATACGYLASGMLLPDNSLFGLPNTIHPRYPNCSVPVALFTAPHHICPGTCTDFTNLSSNATSYQWFFPGAAPATSTDFNPAGICYNTPGTFDVTLVAIGSTGNDTVTLPNYMTVFPFPPAQSILQSGDTLISVPGFTNYQWFYGGDTIPGATGANYIALQSGDYSVIAVDANGCSSEAVVLNVIAQINEDGKSGDENAFTLYPNPAVNELMIIHSLSGKNLTFRIRNTVGEETLISGTPFAFHSPDALSFTIPVAALSSGIYFLELSDGVKSYHTRFVKK